MSELKNRLTGGYSVSNIISIATLLVVIGMWVGGLNSVEDKIKTVEDKIDAVEHQNLLWLDRAELDRKNKHDKVINKLDQLQKDVNHIDGYLIRKDPSGYRSIHQGER